MKTKLITAALLIVSTVTLTMACTSDVHAASESTRVSKISLNNNHITVRFDEDKGIRHYTVNGKTFTWNDLTPNQQARLSAIEEKLDANEAIIQSNEQDIRELTAQVEAKVADVERAAAAIEQALESLDIDNMTVRELQQKMPEIEHLMEENEHLMQAKEVEMLVEESRLFSIDEEAIAALEAQAKVYEQALVEIASELE